MYLVVIGWLYVVLMMAVAEASNATGTLLGAVITFVLYGALPVVLVVYLMGTPARRKARKAREAAEFPAGTAVMATPQEPPSVDPDTGGHAPGAAKADSVAPVGKETR